MAFRILAFTLILPALCLRVQQRGKDVKITANTTIQLKHKTEMKKAQEIISSNIAPGCTNWAEGKGPIYMCSVADLWKVALFVASHPLRCFQGVPEALLANPEATYLEWDAGVKWPYPSIGQAALQNSWEDKFNCLVKVPLKLRALYDPLYMLTLSSGVQQFTSRILDPLGYWLDGSANENWDTNMARVLQFDRQYCHSHYGTYCPDTTCHGSLLASKFTYRNDDPSGTDLLAGDTLLMNICYARREYTFHNEFVNKQFVKCSCNEDFWMRMMHPWGQGSVTCKLGAGCDYIADAFTLGGCGSLFEEYGDCDFTIMKMQYPQNFWSLSGESDPYNSLASYPYDGSGSHTSWDPDGPDSGNLVHLQGLGNGWLDFTEKLNEFSIGHGWNSNPPDHPLGILYPAPHGAEMYGAAAPVVNTFAINADNQLLNTGNRLYATASRGNNQMDRSFTCGAFIMDGTSPGCALEEITTMSTIEGHYGAFCGYKFSKNFWTPGLYNYPEGIKNPAQRVTQFGGHCESDGILR